MRMPEPIRIEMSELINRVQKGDSAEELMARFNIPSREVLKSALMHVEQQTGENIQIPGLIGRASLESQYTRGNRVDPAMLEDTGMPKGPSSLDKAAEEGLGGYNITIGEGVLSIEMSR